MYLGTLIARKIVQGDLDMAYKLAMREIYAWRVCEARAIAGAIRYANQKYGVNIKFTDFAFPQKKELQFGIE